MEQWSFRKAYSKFEDKEWDEVVLMLYKMLVGVINGGCEKAVFTPEHFLVYKNNSIVAKINTIEPHRTTSLHSAFDLIMLRDDVMQQHFQLEYHLSDERIYRVVKIGGLPLEHP